MAFSLSITDRFGTTHPAAYCRISNLTFNKNELAVRIDAYVSDLRPAAGYDPVQSWNYSFTPEMALQAANPLEYAYTLLEQSGEFPTATWRV